MSGTTRSNVAKSLSFEIIRLQVTSGFSLSYMQCVCAYMVGSISTKWSMLPMPCSSHGVYKPNNVWPNGIKLPGNDFMS